MRTFTSRPGCTISAGPAQIGPLSPSLAVADYSKRGRQWTNLRRTCRNCTTWPTSEGPQAERMGETLLVNQFVTGLRADLKRKLIGTEGSLDELVLKARFEEAKTRER